ncbi:MAG: hypothetical protein P4L36_19895 [Holophaga sp.]|nr:hypothetical protein [Holophaga sp.]
MIFARTMLLCLVLLGCERRTQVPDWVRSAPAGAVLATSFRADWALQQPRLQALLERFPMAGRALDLVLVRTRINLDQETGRLTVYQTRPAPAAGFLIQLGGFRDPGGLQVAIADVFPVDSKALDNREHPLFVILDLDASHVRAVADGEGRVWLGDPAALARLAPAAVPNGDLAASAAWMNAKAAIQGFLRPSELPEDLARNLPKGIVALVWGVNPGAGPDSPIGFELCLAGPGEAIEQALPWLQRFAATVTPSQPPEILQESRRVSLRCPLSQEQVDAAMAKLGQPAFPCR